VQTGGEGQAVGEHVLGAMAVWTYCANCLARTKRVTRLMTAVR
jgi:hypothetical protein